MKILVPINDINQVDDYISCGAEEFYLGFYEEGWLKRFGEYGDLNRLTGYGKMANQYDLKEVAVLIKMIKDKGGSAFITFNSSMYSKEQLSYIDRYMSQLSKYKVDGIIVSCPELVELCMKHNLFCVMSTIAGAYNTDIIEFYKKMGAGRVIIPRDVMLSDIRQIVSQVSDMEFEVFIMRSGCRYSDSNCLGLHRSELCTLCGSLDGYIEELGDYNEQYIDNHNLFKNRFHSETCGICTIYDFLKLNINACKVVGRKQNIEEIKSDIRLIKKNIEIALNCSSKEEYLSKMIFPENKDYRCREGLSCYYPEVRF